MAKWPRPTFRRSSNPDRSAIRFTRVAVTRMAARRVSVRCLSATVDLSNGCTVTVTTRF